MIIHILDYGMFMGEKKYVLIYKKIDLKIRCSCQLSLSSTDIGIVVSVGGCGFKCAEAHYPPI